MINETDHKHITLDELIASGRATCSIEEAAACLGIGRSTAYAAARDGSLPSLRLSHRLLVPTAKLRVMLGIPLPEERLVAPARDEAQSPAGEGSPGE